jgi:LCP family protein required for cell wall assembly
VNTETKVVRLLSIPRDLWVYIPGHGYNRVNTADLWGELAKKGTGPDRVKQTIYHNLGIPIHYYVRVDFQGFMQIIDTVGGVDIDVDCPLPDIKLTAGMHHMDGKQALRYARSRKSTNDFDRGRRQRKVLLALWDQALTMNIIPKLPELWRTMSNSFQTDLPLNQVINLAYVGVQLKPQHIKSKAIGPSHVQSWMTPQGAAVLLPREDKIRAMLESFYAPVDKDSLNSVEKVSIQVLNGSQRREAEELAASALRWAGYRISGTGPAERQDHAKTKIVVFNGDAATASKVASELRVPSAEIQDASADGHPGHDIRVVLGADYNPCQR